MPPEFIIGIIAVIAIFIIVIYVISTNNKSITTNAKPADNSSNNDSKKIARKADVRMNMLLNADGTGSLELTIIPSFIGDPNVQNLTFTLSSGKSVCPSNANGLLVKIQSLSVAKNLISFIVNISGLDSPLTILLDTTTVKNGSIINHGGSNYDTSKIVADTGTLNNKKINVIKFFDNSKNKLEFTEIL